eukprot:2394030-Prymnesium_polylepis.1
MLEYSRGSPSITTLRRRSSGSRAIIKYSEVDVCSSSFVKNFPVYSHNTVPLVMSDFANNPPTHPPPKKVLLAYTMSFSRRQTSRCDGLFIPAPPPRSFPLSPPRCHHPHHHN